MIKNKFHFLMISILLCTTSSLLAMEQESDNEKGKSTHHLSSPTEKIQENYICNPEVIFGSKGINWESYCPKQATLSQHTTNAASLHDEGIKGQCKNGRRLVAAVIDSNFHPKYTKLIKKDCIHPITFSKGLIYDPDMNIYEMNILRNKLQQDLDNFEKEPFLNEIDQLIKKEKREEFIYLNRLLNDFRYDMKSGNHGSGIAEALQLIAPEAQLILIDINKRSKKTILFNDENAGIRLPLDKCPLHAYPAHVSKIARAVQKAIKYKADVINISQSISFQNELTEIEETINLFKNKLLPIFKEAVDKNIAIIMSAGNDSFKNVDFLTNVKKTQPYFLDESFKIWLPSPITSGKKELLDYVEGKGIRFAGAVRYRKNGEEKVTSYTQHPPSNMEEHFICAAGNNLPVHIHFEESDYRLFDKGTSLSTPTIAGGYLLLKQFVVDNNYSLSTEDILNIMYTSGRDVKFSAENSIRTDRELKDNVYKSLDLKNAKKKIEEEHRK